ncbi:MAG: hypothetical protein J6Q84_07135 [Kiritimatiellae bacterium]|nr:hypothetical protein [Kiritimatiellia bacterium]
MFNKKLKERIRSLELTNVNLINEVRDLASDVKALQILNNKLEAKVKVLEFKEKANGNKYVIDTYAVKRLFEFIPLRAYTVSYIHKDEVVTHKTDICVDGYNKLEINGEYVEAYSNKELVKVFEGRNDKPAFEEQDVELYKKAYPDRFKTSDINSICKLSAEADTLANTTARAIKAVANLGKEIAKFNEKSDSENKDSADEGETSEAE